MDYMTENTCKCFLNNISATNTQTWPISAYKISMEHYEDSLQTPIYKLNNIRTVQLWQLRCWLPDMWYGLEHLSIRSSRLQLWYINPILGEIGCIHQRESARSNHVSKAPHTSATRVSPTHFLRTLNIKRQHYIKGSPWISSKEHWRYYSHIELLPPEG
jgi:hypothetical protein